jgi:hypothetical protein
MTEKKVEATTFNVSGEGLRCALELRHNEEIKIGKAVSMGALIRMALDEKYFRDIIAKGAQK